MPVSSVPNRLGRHVFRWDFNWLEHARQRQNDKQRDDASTQHGQRDCKYAGASRTGLELPIRGATEVREECQDRKEIVRGEEKPIGCHVEASRGEVEIRIELGNGPAEQNGSDVHQQEEGEVSARAGLQPGDRTPPSLPAVDDEP